MSKLTLLWDNTKALANSNNVAQKAYYRPKTAGGAYLTAGFTPANDLAKSVTSALTPDLTPNLVYQFYIDCLCNNNGPSSDDNGVQEGIIFACIAPTITSDNTSSNILLDVTGLDITQARFTLKKSTDNSLIVAPIIVTKVGTSISLNATGLTAGTNYYWQVELYATVNTVSVLSSTPGNLGSICSPYAIATTAPVVCNPTTSMVVTSVEVP